MTSRPESRTAEWKRNFAARLLGVLCPEGVISDDDELLVYECDGLTGYRIKPIFVVLPKSAEEVSGVVKLCSEEGVPFVPRGAGTGLSGGALPVEEGIVISLARMNRILEIDLENQRVVVEPGVVNISVTNAVSAAGYYYAPDPSSQIVCTIGGNVAENSGGVHCLKYGVTTNHITGLEVVLANGEIITLGGKSADATGYDLLGLFVGSEGLLGIATKITLKILRKPETMKTLFASFDRVEDAGLAVASITARGVIPAGMEIMDNLSIRAVEDTVHAGYPVDAGAILLVELDGPSAEVEAETPIVMGVLTESNALEIKIARNMDERNLFWKGRKSAFAAMGRMSPDYYVQDGVIPRTKLPEVLGRIGELSSEYGLRVANVFHAGDGNLHPLVLYDGAVEGEAERAEELSGEILKVCVAVGGSITGEHGVGHDKKRFMPLMFDDASLEAMNFIRCAFDPNGLCNPGKVFPTPRSCVEAARAKYEAHPVEAAGLGERF
ncbi:MAG: FAD-linked oxidase C-terminal domain-containing protein [Deltaproteobacteria bacterium]